MKTTTRTEGILPALETAHAVAALPELLAGVGGIGGRGRTRYWSCSASRVAVTRTSPPSSASPSRAMGRRPVTGAPETTEKETWGEGCTQESTSGRDKIS